MNQPLRSEASYKMLMIKIPPLLDCVFSPSYPCVVCQAWLGRIKGSESWGSWRHSQHKLIWIMQTHSIKTEKIENYLTHSNNPTLLPRTKSYFISFIFSFLYWGMQQSCLHCFEYFSFLFEYILKVLLLFVESWAQLK